MSLLKAAQKDAPRLTSLRRLLHRHPEPSGEEYETARLIEQELDRLGIRHERVGETGVVGYVGGTAQGEAIIALRADTDALHIPDAKSVEYRSQNEGIMHACGHDAHTAALLGAAALLAENRSAFGGEVRLFFQQAEEIGAGAKQFIKAGLMQGVGRVLGIHVASALPLGKIVVRGGAMNASVDHFTIPVKGRAAHVSTPHKGVDALFIASSIVVGLQGVATRRVDPTDPVILGVGRFEAGTAYNIVAEEAVLEGTTRTFSPETRAFVNAQVDALAKSTAAQYGGEAGVEWEDFASPLVNHADVAEEVAPVAAAIVGGENVLRDSPRSLGGDDFAEFLLEAPGIYALVGTGNPDITGTTLPHHNGGFDIDEAALPTASALYADTAIHWLNSIL